MFELKLFRCLLKQNCSFYFSNSITHWLLSCDLHKPKSALLGIDCATIRPFWVGLHQRYIAQIEACCISHDSRYLKNYLTKRQIFHLGLILLQHIESATPHLSHSLQCQVLHCVCLINKKPWLTVKWLCLIFLVQIVLSPKYLTGAAICLHLIEPEGMFCLCARMNEWLKPFISFAFLRLSQSGLY